jgi:hypothetical protein
MPSALVAATLITTKEVLPGSTFQAASDRRQ